MSETTTHAVPPTAQRAVPLNYGQAPSAWVDYERRFQILVTRLGGWRQMAFSGGVASASAGIGLMSGIVEAGWLLGVGGLLIGLCIQLPRWKE